MKSDSSKRETQENLISQLNEKLISYMVKSKPVAIHLHTGKLITRITIIPDEVIVTEKEFCLEYKSLYFSIENKIDYIEYVNDYEYDCYYVIIDNTEIFIDFI